MVMQREYDGSERGFLEKRTQHPAADYTLGEQTEGAPTQVFVDKSQHTTNYVTINVTGTLPEEFQTHSPPTGGVHIDTAKRVEEMHRLFEDMKSTLDDPASFEERIGRLLTCLGEIEDRGSGREGYFLDLICLLRMILSTIEAEEMNEEIVSSLTDVVTGLRETVTEQSLRGSREKLRLSGLDLLRPFKTRVDVRSILQEMFPDEDSA